MSVTTKYRAEKPCKRGHNMRYLSTRTCVECALVHKARYRNDGRYRDQVSKYNKNYYEKHSDRNRARASAYHAANKEKSNENSRRWRETNKPKKREYERRARARRRNCAPAWRDKEAILIFYQEAERLSNLTGIQHEVDHIVPIAGKSVCGLHVHWNLQVLPWYKNRSKHAKLVEDRLIQEGRGT